MNGVGLFFVGVEVEASTSGRPKLAVNQTPILLFYLANDE